MCVLRLEPQHHHHHRRHRHTCGAVRWQMVCVWFQMNDVLLYTYPQQDGKYRLKNTLSLTGMKVRGHLTSSLSAKALSLSHWWNVQWLIPHTLKYFMIKMLQIISFLGKIEIQCLVSAIAWHKITLTSLDRRVVLSSIDTFLMLLLTEIYLFADSFFWIVLVAKGHTTYRPTHLYI